MIAGDPGPVLIISSRMGNSWPNNPAHLDPIPTILNHHLLIITNTQHCVSRRCVNSLNLSLFARNWRPTTRRDKKVKIARNSTRGLILRWYFANCGCNVTWSIIELSHSSRCRQCPDPNYDIGNKNVAQVTTVLAQSPTCCCLVPAYLRQSRPGSFLRRKHIIICDPIKLIVIFWITGVYGDIWA